MKTPISYYGGKQTMLKYILPLIDTSHVCYCEPFFGGGSVFFAKPISEVECINDINDFVINFYRVLKNNFDELKKEIDYTLHSRSLYNKAKDIYKNSDEHNDIKKAWAMWTRCNMCFGKALDTGWAFVRKSKNDVGAVTIFNRKQNFTKQFEQRMKNVQIECDDALNVIRRFDSSDTLFYLDPPYLGADQGHYFGWIEQNEIDLLTLLTEIKGKFLLSSYPSEILSDFRKKYNWHYKDIPGWVKVNNKSGQKARKEKIECLTWNYEVKDKQLEIF